MPSDSEVHVQRTCQSCATQGPGSYCSACGERFLTTEDFSFSHFIAHDLAHELIHWDGKIGRTLRILIAKPGEYASRFVLGQRKPYLNPVRLYLVVFILQAFVGGIGTRPLTLSERAERYDPTGFSSRLAIERGLDIQQSSRAGRDAAAAHWIAELGTLLIAFLVSVVQMLVLRRYRRRYIEHLTLSLTVVTFSMLAMIVASLLALAIGHGHISDNAEALRSNAAAIVLPVYWFFAIRRFYGAPVVASLLYTVAITMADFAIALILNVAIVALLIAAE